MTIASREAAILRVRAQGIHPELSKSLSDRLGTAVVGTVKTVMEEALQKWENFYRSWRSRNLSGQAPIVEA